MKIFFGQKNNMSKIFLEKSYIKGARETSPRPKSKH